MMGKMEIEIIIMRFLIVFILALAFGIERQRSHKPIGFGTFIFVSIGSCGLAITAILLNPDNPLPLLSAIVTGIGFLGAGALIKTTDHIFGFTTAASIWVFAILGLVIGVGKFEIGILIYLFLWAVVFVDKLLERRGVGSYRKKIHITLNKEMEKYELLSLLGIDKHKTVNTEVNKKQQTFSYTFFVQGSKENIERIPKILSDSESVESFRME